MTKKTSFGTVREGTEETLFLFFRKHCAFLVRNVRLDRKIRDGRMVFFFSFTKYRVSNVEDQVRPNRKERDGSCFLEEDIDGNKKVFLTGKVKTELTFSDFNSV